MGMLVKGKWEVAPLAAQDKQGRFVRADSVFRHWISKEGKTGYKAEPDRYHLYISYACPWASRTIAFLALKGLENVISFSTVDPILQENGWEFTKTYPDNLNHARYLYELYLKADPNYSGKVSVPVLWDKVNKTIVNNESSEIIRMLNAEFNDWAKNTYDFYPKALQKEIDEINDFVYKNINNGVYKCGFAGSQEAYEEAFDALFSALETLEKRLSQQKYLVDNQITEADWRLFTTLIRFDVVYVGHFKCNLKRIADYPHLANYLRELYQTPGIQETVNFSHIKQHYYISHKAINPTGIVPKGPEIDYLMPHSR